MSRGCSSPEIIIGLNEAVPDSSTVELTRLLRTRLSHSETSFWGNHGQRRVGDRYSTRRLDRHAGSQLRQSRV